MSVTVSLQDVSKRYTRRQCAVDGLSLDIEPGEFLVLLGPSGCGKSTVLRLIAGLEEATGGTVLIGGRPVGEIPPQERNLAMVFQNFALYPHMTCRQNIAFPLHQRTVGPAEISSLVTRTTKALGIEALAERRPSHLSGGERQRVAIGRAIVREPSLFLLDEPLSNIDAALRGQLRAEIAQLTRTLGVTTVYVTHDQAEAMSMGDRVAVLRDGTLQQIGTPRDVYELPANMFVATFVGTPHINMLRATIRAPISGGVVIDFGRQRFNLPEPLSPHYQMLRVHQGRSVAVGVRANAVRMGPPGGGRPNEFELASVIRRVEYQGHELLLHLDAGTVAAELPAWNSPSQDEAGRSVPSLLGSVAEWWAHWHTASEPTQPTPDKGTAHPVQADLLVRAPCDPQLYAGRQLSAFVDLQDLYVFDQDGVRICPSPVGTLLLER